MRIDSVKFSPRDASVRIWIRSVSCQGSVLSKEFLHEYLQVLLPVGTINEVNFCIHYSMAACRLKGGSIVRTRDTVELRDATQLEVVYHSLITRAALDMAASSL
jgi:hypothetical protein